MNHISLIDGRSYEIGKINEYEGNATYDINTIMYFPTDEEMDKGSSPMIIVGWYFGDYEFESTEYYINEFYKKKSK